MSITAKIDVEKFNWIDGGEYELQGWAYCKEAKDGVKIRLFADEEELSCEQERTARPDVQKTRKDLKISDPRIGFRVRLKNLEKILASGKNLEIRAAGKDEETVLKTVTTGELGKAYRDASLSFFVDSVITNGKTVLIQGWAIDQLRAERIRVEDGTGKEIPADIQRVCRNDVARAWSQPQDYRCGFKIQLDRDAAGDSLKLCLENEYIAKSYEVDLKKADYENSKQAKLRRALSRRNARQNLQVLKEQGLFGFENYIKEQVLTENERYMAWLKRHSATKRELQRQRRTQFANAPLFSIVVPLYNTPERFLKELIDSVCAQSYGNWELCLADGSTSKEPGEIIRRDYGKEKRIRYQKLTKNGGIAGNSNAAIKMAKGDYLVFADHDDVLTPDALYEIAKALNEHPDTDIVYTDEDLMDAEGKVFSDPRCKPDFNLDFLRSINYICHIFTVRRTLAIEAGLIRTEFDGAQDHEFILRCCERTKRIAHVPKILYHWRAHQGSTAGNQDSKRYAIDAARRGIEEHYQRLGLDAKVEYTDTFIVFRSFFIPKGNPLVSVIIPNKDQKDTLKTCLDSIFEKTEYPNYEIIIIENNSTKKETFDYYEEIQREHENVRVVTWEKGFNYSAINNFGVGFAKGEYLLFLNNDVEVITPSWMTRLTGFCQREDVGAAGAKLLYPDDTIQHGGVVIGIGWFAGHVQSFMRRTDAGYFGRLIADQDISAVTAACMMVKRSAFEEAGGFEEKLAVAMNDVDLCLKIRSHGHLIVMDPGTELYHYESKSRGDENTPEKRERFKREVALFRERWKKLLDEGDPYYNPNLTLLYGDCSMRREHEVPQIYRELFGGKK